MKEKANAFYEYETGISKLFETTLRLISTVTM